MGATFLPGEVKLRPGVYVRVANAGDPPALGVSQGIVAALFRSTWGPLGQSEALEALEAVDTIYGTAGTTDAAREAFRGGCRRVLACRLGTGGVVATAQLTDTAAEPANAVRIDARHPGTRGNSLTFTLRDSLADATRRDLLVYEGTTLRQTVTFAKGADEPDALVAAVTAAGSDWITATKLVDGNGTLAAANQETLAGGTDPVITGTDYGAALTAIEALAWNVLAVDSEDVTVHATVQTYIDRVRGDGKRVLGILGEPTSVALATRLTNAKAFNDPAVVYALNGFKGSDGATREGYKAAARLAGMIAGAAVTDSLTHAVVTGAAGVAGALTIPDIERAIQSGAIVFTTSAAGQVQVEYGINTLVTPSANQDAGWQKIRRMRTRDNLMDRIVGSWDPLIGRLANSPDGRATLIAVATGVVRAMIAEGALLSREDGRYIIEDPAKPPAGDSAWFVAQVDDLDSVEHLYLPFAFRFAPQS